MRFLYGQKVMTGVATGSSLCCPFSASGITENSSMTALSRYLLMLGMAMEYKKAALVKEKRIIENYCNG